MNQGTVLKKRKAYFNLIKKKDIDPFLYSAKKFDYTPIQYVEDGGVEERIKTVPAICSFFSCAKKLSLRESLFGNRCINHQRGSEDITINIYDTH